MPYICECNSYADDRAKSGRIQKLVEHTFLLLAQGIDRSALSLCNRYWVGSSAAGSID